MKNNDFDKIFARKFDRLPGEPYREENWSELSHRLDAYDGRKRWVLPLLLPLLTLLAGGNIFWWYQWREAAQKNNFSGSHTTIVQSDTIFRSTVVYRYDTVYQAVTHVRWRFSGASNPFRAGEKTPSFFPAGDFAPKDLAALQNQQEDTSARSAGAVESAENTVKYPAALPGEKERTATEASSLSSQTANQPPTVENSENSAGNTIPLSIHTPEPVKKAGSPAFYPGRPRLGFNAGWANPSLPGKLSGTIMQIGFSTDAEVARNLRLGVAVHYDRTSLKSNNTVALNDKIRIPDPGQDFSLKYWETYRLPALSYVVQVSWSLPLRNKTWSPWIGVGAQAATFFPYSVEFEFENETNNIELHLPAQTNTYSRWQGVLMRAGADISLNRHIALGIEGFLLRRFDRKPAVSDNQTGFKTNLYYIF